MDEAPTCDGKIVSNGPKNWQLLEAFVLRTPAGNFYAHARLRVQLIGKYFRGRIKSNGDFFHSKSFRTSKQIEFRIQTLVTRMPRVVSRHAFYLISAESV